MILAVLQALGFAPAGALLARQPLTAIPAAVLLTQSVNTSWALLDFAVLAVGALATSRCIT